MNTSVMTSQKQQLCTSVDTASTLDPASALAYDTVTGPPTYHIRTPPWTFLGASRLWAKLRLYCLGPFPGAGPHSKRACALDLPRSALGLPRGQELARASRWGGRGAR